MDRDEFIENLRTTLLWETVCAHIEVMAAGKLDIPNHVSYPYDSYDFEAMGKKELLGMCGRRYVVGLLENFNC